MQLLYTMSRDKKLTTKEAIMKYHQKIGKSFEVFLLNLLYLTKVAGYALKDASIRDSKLLPSEEDKRFSTKLYDNDLVKSLVENEELNKLFKKYKLQGRLNQDLLRNIYTTFASDPAYKDYLNQNDSDPDDHRQMLLSLYKCCIKNEMFNETIEDDYYTWIDDKSLIVGSMKKIIKALPLHGDFYDAYKPSDEAVIDFGEVLIKNVIDSNSELLSIIEPALQNWDAERVAVMDMIILKMALVELMSFPTIPTKVTLNEFVEISKVYSTEKSKDFINGILDRLMKKLHNDGKIKKEGRGLVE